MSLAQYEAIWGQKGDAIITQSFHDAMWSAESARQRECEIRLDMLEGDWMDHLVDTVNTIYVSQEVRDSINGLLTTEHNVFLRIMSEIATVYKWGATRTIRGDKRQDEIARLLWQEADIDAALEQANLIENGLGDIIIVPDIIDGKLHYHIVDGARSSVIQHPKDPTRAVAFWFRRHRWQSPTVGANWDIVYGDAEEWRIYDQAFNLKDVRKHGLGRLPAVIVHRERRRDCFWEPSRKHPVAEVTLQVAALICMLGRLQYLQGELQPTYQGKPSDIVAGQGIGADTIWAGPGSWGTLNLQASPEHYIAHINARIGWVAQNFGLSADVYNLTGAPTSGFQIRLKRLPLEEQRRKQIKRWRVAERDLWQLTAELCRREHPTLFRVDPAANFDCNHNEMPFIEDPQAMNDVLLERIAAGWEHPTAGMIARDPDLTEDEALERMMKNLADKAKLDALKTRANSPKDPTAPAASPEVNGAKGQKPDEQDDEDEQDDTDDQASAAE